MTTEPIFRAAFWVLFAGVLVMRVYFSVRVRLAGERLMPDGAAVEREGRGMFTLRVVMFLALMTWLVLYAVNPSWMKFLSVPFPAWLRWLGFALGIASLGFWTWVQSNLGKQFSAQLQLRKEHHLVTTGPYRRIRHPLYTGMFGFGAGIALLTANWVFIGLSLVIIAGIVARVPREEQMLIGEFGEEYKGYIKRTGRFFPKL